MLVYICTPAYNMNANLKYLELDSELTIAFTDNGAKDKPVVLFIHGLANYLQVWQWNILVLQNTARCIAIDLPGNGFSSRGDFDYSIDFYAKLIPRFLRALHIKEVVLAGHSMGGQIALQAALYDREIVKGLLLFAPAGFEYYAPHEAVLFKSAIAFGNFLNMDEVHIAQSINSSFYEQNAMAQKIIDELSHIIKVNDRISYRRMLEKCINSMLDHQLYYELKNVSQPTLAFFGEDDMLIPNRFLHPMSTREIAQSAVAQMPNAQLKMFSKTGHFVQIERAAEVNSAIQLFLQKF